MRYVSVCAGIEAATVAWHPLGWTPVLFSEIEAFPCAVLRHHYPDVPLIGDFTQLLDPAFPCPAADLLVGGTPCQAFSVAGKRLSLEDYRGNLSLAFADLSARFPWTLWENVPGCLSTHDNAFGNLLGRLVGYDAALDAPDGKRWPGAGVVEGPTGVAAWRVLDAQWFGVAQRRRRVFVLIGRGAGAWAAADALLPLGESVSRHPPARRTAGETAPTIPSRGTAGGGLGTDFDCDGGPQAVSPAVSAGAPFARTGNERVEADALVPEVTGCVTAISGGHAMGAPEVDAGLYVPEVVGTLSDGAHRGGGLNGQDAYSGRIIPVLYDERSVTSPVNRSNPQPGDPSPTLHEPERLMVTAIRTAQTCANGHGVAEDVAYTLDQTNGQAVVAPTLSATNDPSRSPQSAEVTQQVAAVHQATMAVRRLTPIECARLQGFPDHYLDIPFKGKPATDGHKYRALGNSMAVPVMHYIGRRLAAQLTLSSPEAA